MSKACQYAINHNQVCNGMHELNLKDVQSFFYSIITWTKNSWKGLLKGEKACVKVFLLKKKLKTPMKTRFSPKVVLF